MQSFKMRLNRFVRSFVTLDLRSDEETRRIRCERFALKNKTCGKPATFAIGPEPNVSKLHFNRELVGVVKHPIRFTLAA